MLNVCDISRPVTQCLECIAGFWFLSYARDAVSLISPTEPAHGRNRTVIGEAFQKMYHSMSEENPKGAKTINQISEEEAKRSMEDLVKRIENLEATETSNVVSVVIVIEIYFLFY